MKHSLLTLTLLLSCGAFADHYWKGAGETSDWADAGNWINDLSNNNTVFGGAQINSLPESSLVTLSSLYTSGKRLWVESNPRVGVTFDLSEGASEDAGWTTTDTGEPTWTIGTGRGGDLTIKAGSYTLPKGAYIASGTQDSSLTMNGGVLNAGTKFCVSTSSAQGTLTMNGGTINCTLTSGDALAIGKNGTGILNMNGGTINCATGFYLSQDSGTSELNMTGGKINVTGGGNVVFARGWNSAVTSTVNLTGGEIESAVTVQSGVGRNDGTLNMLVDNGAKLSIINGKELILGNAKTQTTLGITNGTVKAEGNIYLGQNASSSADVTLENGEFSSANGRVCVSDYGTSSLTVNGGYVTWGDQLMVAFRANSTGSVAVNGGRVEANHLLQVGLNGHGTFVQNGGSVACSSFRLGTDSATGVGEATLNGGSLLTEYISVGTGTGTLVLNGVTLKARSDHEAFIPANERLTVTLGEGGFSLDTAGHAVTVPASLVNDETLVGNAPIGKKGLGTLTLSADLDLSRTFTFTIDQGVGPIALAGANNTLAETAKINAVINPVRAEPGVAYTVLTGLGDEITMDDITLSSSNDKYTCTGMVTDGNLMVTLSTTAAVSARYVNGEWCFYDADGQLIEGGEAADITTFVFTGAEPTGEIAAAIATGHAVVLEAKLQGEETVTNTFTLTSSLMTGRVTVDADAGCAVRIVCQGEMTFAPETFTFSNTVIFASEGEGAALTIAKDLTSTTAGRVVFDAGTITFNGDINQDLEVNGKLVRTVAWSPNLYFFGSGEIEMLGAKLTIEKGTSAHGTEWFQGFNGTLTIGADAELENLTDLHAENNGQGPYYFLGEGTILRMAGGTVTRFGGGTNNENIKNVEIVAGTTNVWNNYKSRSGNMGVNMNLTGTITGSGTLRLRCGGRAYRITSDLTEFGGTLICEGEASLFWNGIKGAKVIAESGSGIYTEGKALVVDNVDLTLKGNHGAKGNWSSGDHAIGAGTVLKVAENLTVHGITFAPGSSIELIDEGALTDVKTKYVLLTSVDPISVSRTTPMLVQKENPRGTWKLVVEEVREQVDDGEGNVSEQTTGYQLCAQFRPKGFVVIIQ